MEKKRKYKLIIISSLFGLLLFFYLGFYISYRLSERIVVGTNTATGEFEYRVWCTYYSPDFPTHPRADETLEQLYFPLYSIEIGIRKIYFELSQLI